MIFIITIGILLFPQVEELDFVGPFEVISYVNKIQPNSVSVQLLAETLAPVHAFNGMKVLPDITLAGSPPLDIVIIPGGKGRLLAMNNPIIREFILQQSKTAQFVTAVCTGAFLLAEAELLTGKKATTHHTAYNELESYSVEVLHSKVVRDGQIITSGGVSSGLELGLYLLKELFGADISQKVANAIEYEIDVNTL